MPARSARLSPYTLRHVARSLFNCLLLPAMLSAAARGAAQIDLDSGPPDAEAAAPSVVDYLWLDTVPAGAVVEIDGVNKGRTPFFINGLKAGQHQVRFLKDGYEPLARTLPVPNAGEPQRFTLRLLDGVCLIDSTPPGASVLHGTQLLGRTPLVLRGWTPDTYSLKLLRYGYKPAAREITIADGRPEQIAVTLQPDTAPISVVTMPARAKIFIDNAYKGSTRPVTTDTNRSRPLVLRGFRPGKHKVEMVYGGVHAEPKTVSLDSGKRADVMLMLWYPDTRVKLRNGKTVVGMLVQKNAAGDIVVARSLTDHQRYLKERIDSVSTLTAEETRKRLAERAAHPPRGR